MNYILLIKTLVGAIHAVEELMPQSSGKEKFDAALATVEAVAGDVSAVAPGLFKIATTIVNGLREAGVFAKKA